MPWAVAGAAIGAAGALGAGAMQSSAQGKAAAQQQKQFEQQRMDLMPYREAGLPAVGATQDLLGLNGPDAAAVAMDRFQTSPGYQFQLSEGLRGIEAGNAARGILRSGATEKAEMKYAEGLANQDFSNYYNRLFDLSKLGETAAAGGAYTANAAANAAGQAANAQSSIYGDAAKGLSSTVNGLFNNPDFRSWVGGSSSTTPYTNFASSQNYASSVAGPTVSGWFGI